MILVTGIMSITIEEIQMMSNVFLVATAVLAVLAVILFICFDISNIWGVIVKHTLSDKSRRGMRVTEPLPIKEKIEEKNEEKRETILLDSMNQMERKELAETNVKTVLLESPKSTMHIFQDQTYIHTDIRIT